MVRSGLLSVVAALWLLNGSAPAQPAASSDPQVDRVVAVQKAMAAAREALAQNRAAEAVAALERELPYINGNANYLALLRDAYAAHLKELLLANREPARIEHVRRRLRILDPKANLDGAPAVAVVPTSAPSPAGPTPPAPAPTPAAPSAPEPTPPAAPSPAVRGPVPAAPTPDDDPFQQTPSDAKTDLRDLVARAFAAFQSDRFAEANTLFAEAYQRRAEMSAEECGAWGYSKLFVVATQLKQSGNSALPLADLEREAEFGLKLGGGKLDRFGQTVLAEVRRLRHKPGSAASQPSAIPEGWQAVETGNFRVLHRQGRELADRVARAAEEARKAVFEKWSGPAGADWSPRCDVWLHPKADDYAKATDRPAASPGHSTVTLQGPRVVGRRIDLRCDDSALLDGTLPHEIAYVVISDLFADQPLPRWADVGMTALSEPPGQLARYLRAVPRCHQERKLFAVSELLKMAEFPDAASITPFYAESVSLVDFLVRQKGTKAFTLFLREAPRRGYEKALQSHYGFRDCNDLQERWLKFACGQ